MSGPALALRFEGVHKRFAGGPVVLRDFTAELPAQGITFVVGHSGEGKSVLCRLAVGLLTPDAGGIELLGQSLEGMDERRLLRLRARAPYLVQGAALLDGLTLRENAALTAQGPPSERAARVSEALRSVGVEGWADRYPSTVGPGIQKRAAIARALVLRPEYLLFDEPTTGLDSDAAAQVNATLGSLRDQGLGALVVSHDYAALEALANWVLWLRAGGVGYWGPPGPFLASGDPEVRSLLGH